MTWSERLRTGRCLIFGGVLCLLLTVPLEEAFSQAQKKEKSSGRVSKNKETVVPQAAEPQEFKRLKRRLAIIDFENKSDFTGADLGRAVTDMLITALNKSGKFIIIEREELETVLQEEIYAKGGEFTAERFEKVQKLEEAESLPNIGISGYLTPSAFIKIGDILKLDAIATGGVAEFGPSQVVGFFETTRFKVGLDMHLVDARKGTVLSAEHAVKVSDKQLNRSALEAVDFHTSEFLQGVMGMTAREVVNSLVEKTIKAMTSRPWEGRVMKIEGDNIYINAGSEVGLKEADRLVVYREGERLIDPVTGALFEVKEEKIGALEIVKTEDNFSICRVCEQKEIKEKDLVRLEEEALRWGK